MCEKKLGASYILYVPEKNYQKYLHMYELILLKLIIISFFLLPIYKPPILQLHTKFPATRLEWFSSFFATWLFLSQNIALG
jgi:hypothetical protein